MVQTKFQLDELKNASGQTEALVNRVNKLVYINHILIKKPRLVYENKTGFKFIKRYKLLIGRLWRFLYIHY